MAIGKGQFRRGGDGIGRQVDSRGAYQLILISKPDGGGCVHNNGVGKSGFKTRNGCARRLVNHCIEIGQTVTGTKVDGVGCGIRRGSRKRWRCDIDFGCVQAETDGISKSCRSGKVDNLMELIRGTWRRDHSNNFGGIATAVGREPECVVCLIDNNVSESG